MKSSELSLGQLVKAKAGRDKDKLFFVIGIIDDQYVYIADGSRRKVEAPKKKKQKHLQRCRIIQETITLKIDNGETLENAFIRRQLAQYQKEEHLYG